MFTAWSPALLLHSSDQSVLFGVPRFDIFSLLAVDCHKPSHGSARGSSFSGCVLAPC